MKEPARITQEVCDVCGIDWEKHHERAKRRAHNEWDAQHNQDPHERYVAFPDYITVKVQVEECIYLLKHVNQGPIGYTGPMGMSGRDAPGYNNA